MKNGLVVLVAVAGLTSPPVFSAETRYIAAGDPSDRTRNHFLEVWGVGSYERYAMPATNSGDDFDHLISSVSAWSDIVSSRIISGGIEFGYDRLAPIQSTTISGRTAYYAAGNIDFSSSTALNANPMISSMENQVSVSATVNGNRQTLNFGRIAATVEGSLPGQGLGYSAPQAFDFQVDLVSLLNSAYYSNGFDVAGFGTLPVRLTSPTVFNPVYLGVSLFRSKTGGGFTTALPNSLSFPEFNGSFFVAYDGVFDVSVVESDFESNSDYILASNWVNDNIRQISYEFQDIWTISSLTAVAEVPEPATWALALGGALLLGMRHRRNRHTRLAN